MSTFSLCPSRAFRFASRKKRTVSSQSLHSTSRKFSRKIFRFLVKKIRKVQWSLWVAKGSKTVEKGQTRLSRADEDFFEPNVSFWQQIEFFSSRRHSWSVILLPSSHPSWVWREISARFFDYLILGLDLTYQKDQIHTSWSFLPLLFHLQMLLQFPQIH